MEKYLQLKKSLIEWYLDLYLYYVKGIEDGPRIEKRMLKYQKDFEKWCKKRKIALVAFKNTDNNVSLSFVKEEAWDAQNEKIQQEIMDEMMAEKGNEISPERHQSIEEEVKKLLQE